MRRMATADSLPMTFPVDSMRAGAWSGPRSMASSDVRQGADAGPEQRSFDLTEPVDRETVVGERGLRIAENPDAGGAEGIDATDTESPPARSAAAGTRGRDALTGLLDAVAFEDVLAHEDAREGRYRRPATVVMLELDGLERLVERLGPAAGERVEPALADTISRLARRADYVARLGPGHFAVLMPETDEIVAINYIERVRRACELWLESGAIAMRLAIGWASTSGDVSLAAVMRTAADRMHIERRRNARLLASVVAGVDPPRS